MLRNAVSVFAGVLLHYLLILASSRLAWHLIVSDIDSTTIGYKEGVVEWMLWRTLAIDPAAAVVVAVFVACVVQRSYWWLGGIATIPVIIYVCCSGVDRIEIGASAVYLILAFVAAFVVSRFKRWPAA